MAEMGHLFTWSLATGRVGVGKQQFASERVLVIVGTSSNSCGLPRALEVEGDGQGSWEGGGVEEEA